MPLLSVIIPVYKVEDYLCQCVNSVIDQSFKDLQIILVNDGSPDNCPVICDEFASKDHRVKVIHKLNGGISDARNVGVLAATGEYILFLDSDDFWRHDDFLMKLSKVVLEQPELDVINFGWVKYYPSSQTYVQDARNFNLERNKHQSSIEYVKILLENDLYVACPWNKCIKKSFLSKHLIQFKKGFKSEDMDWCGQILSAKPNMGCFENSSYVYRQQRKGSITNSVDQAHLEDIIFMIKTSLEFSKELEIKEQNVYLSFFAVQYLTLLFNIGIAKNDIVVDLSKDVYEMRGILDFNLNPKVKKVNKFMKLFGYRLTTEVLRLYVLNLNK